MVWSESRESIFTRLPFTTLALLRPMQNCIIVIFFHNYSFTDLKGPVYRIKEKMSGDQRGHIRWSKFPLLLALLEQSSIVQGFPPEYEID